MESEYVKPIESSIKERKEPKKVPSKRKPLDRQEPVQSVSVDEKQQKISEQTSVVSISEVRFYIKF